MSSKFTRNNAPLWVAAVICGLASLFYVYDYFVQVAPSIMTHQLMSAFNIDAASLGILGSCFFITYTLMQIPAGMLLDRWGARKTLTISAFISALGVVLFAVAHDLWQAEVARALIGFGSAFSFLSTVFLLSRWFKHQYFACLIGFLQFAGAVGSIFGQGPLAYFINEAGWREATWWIGIGSFVLTILFLLIIRDGRLSAEEVKEAAQKAAAEKGSLKIVFKNPQVWWVSICGYVAWAPASAFAALWGVPFIMQAYHLQNEAAGTLFTVFWLVVGIGGPIVGWFSDKIGRRRLPLLLGFFIGLLSSIGILNAGHYPLWVAGVFLFLLGVAVSVQALTFGVIKDIVPDSRFATASGLNNMITVLSGAMLQPIVGALLTHFWTGEKLNGVPVYSTHAYQMGLSVVPVVMLIGFLVVLFFVKETYCKKQA